MSALAWMAWTKPVAIFFVSIALLIAGMIVWELRSPTVARKGFLPLVTTRGDRLFVGLLAAAYVNLAWTGLTELPQLYGAGIAAIVVIVVMKWG
jgi:predicted small integral membrane protein